MQAIFWSIYFWGSMCLYGVVTYPFYHKSIIILCYLCGLRIIIIAYIRFFETHPIYKSYFGHMTESKNGVGVQRRVDHDQEIMRTMGNIVGFVRNPEMLKTLTLEMVRNHYAKGVRPNQYRVSWVNRLWVRQ